MIRSLRPGSALHEAPRCPADEFRALLKRGKLSGSAAARIAGANPRTIRRWIGGDSEIPYSAWSLIQAHVEQEEMVAEATAEHIAWQRAMDAEPLPDSAEATETSLVLLQNVAREQYSRVCRLEDELQEARSEHRATQRRLNRMLAEELKGDDNGN